MRTSTAGSIPGIVPQFTVPDVYGQRELVVRDLNGLIIALGEEAPFRPRG
jgi:hypothetical protein